MTNTNTSTTQQETIYELFVGNTHDSFELDAKSLALAQIEARKTIREYYTDLSAQKMNKIVKSAVIEVYTATYQPERIFSDGTIRPHRRMSKTLQSSTPVTL